MRQNRYCLCGDAISVQSANPMDVAHLLRLFEVEHSGEDHGMATREQASIARQRKDRARVREYAARWDAEHPKPKDSTSGKTVLTMEPDSASL